MCLKIDIGLNLICCVTLSAFCEEPNGDSEDARTQLKTFENLQRPSTTFNNLQSHIHLDVYTCGAH
eukprot:11524447-Heterocapsa_arctica.AAC.1